MPRRSKGPRLYLRSARRNSSGTITHVATWIIRDGARDTSTGLDYRASETDKEKALAKYIDAKHTGDADSSGTRDPTQIPVQDVLDLYGRDVAPKHARPHETAVRIQFLQKFWMGRRLSEIVGKTCRDYAAQRSTDAAARRELEELRAAINYHRKEGLHDRIVSVVLPDRNEARERWLTRQEAAAAIRHAWRYREQQNFRSTDRRTRRHVARFMLVASYMGSRAAVICGASIEAKRPSGKPWVDLSTGTFYGRPARQKATKKRRQTVKVPPPLLAHLRRWQARGQRYVVEWNGAPVQRVTKAHNAVVAAVGLGLDVTPHTWRHTAVTWVMQQGGDAWDTADFFGMTVEVLERVYGHHHPKHSAGVLAAMATRRTRNATDMSEQKAKTMNRNEPQPIENATEPV